MAQQLEMITSSSRASVKDKYNEWSKKHPNARVTHAIFEPINQQAAVLTDYTLLVFYDEAEESDITVEQAVKRIQREIAETEGKYDVSRNILEGIEHMSGQK